MRIALATSALLAAGAGFPVLAQTLEHAHAKTDHSHHAADAAGTDVAAGPFMTDAPLRAGMRRVRDSVEALVDLKPTSADSTDARVLDLTTEIDSAAQWIFAECKLPADADAALHPLLAQLLQANAALRDAPASREPVTQMQDVLTRYDEQFYAADAEQSADH